MTLRASVALLAICFANSLYLRPALAADDHPYAKEAAKVLCEWIEPRQIPTGVKIPHVCFAPDKISLDDAYQEIMGFWAEWNVVDASASRDAQKSFNEEWSKRWNELRATSVTAAAQPNDNDSDYSCRAAQNMCRDGMSMCAEYRQDFIRAGRVCPGVTDVAIPASAQQAYDAESARQQAVAICQEAMRLRPLPNHTQGSGAINVYAGIVQNQNERAAAVQLCLSDPQAQLKPLPWETSAAPVQPAQPSPSYAINPPGAPAFLTGQQMSGMNTICFYNQAGSAMVITIPVGQPCSPVLQ